MERMENWYKKPVVKGILIGVMFLSVLLSSVTLAYMVRARMDGITAADLFTFSEKKYEDSQTFENRMTDMTYSAIDQIFCRKEFERDGAYDPDKAVDIVEFYNTKSISEKYTSGLEYTLGDLVIWSEQQNKWGWQSTPGGIIVCEKKNGKYQYYYRSEFEQLQEEHSIYKINMEDGQKETIEPTADSEDVSIEITSEDGADSGYYLYDEKSKTTYVNWWAIDQEFSEPFSPIGAVSLLEVVNTNTELNGQLTDIYQWIKTTVETIGNRMEKYEDIKWSKGNSNYKYSLEEKRGKLYYTNGEHLDLEELKKNKNYKYISIQPELEQFESNMAINAEVIKGMVEETLQEENNYVFTVAIDTTYPIQDQFYTEQKLYESYRSHLGEAGIKLVLSIVLFLAAIVWLTMISGRSEKDEELHLLAFDSWKTEISAAAVILPWIIITILFAEMDFIPGSLAGYGPYGLLYDKNVSIDIFNLMVLMGYAVLSLGLFLTGYLSLVRRIKARILWKNSLLYHICKMIALSWQNRNVILKTALVLGGFVFFHLIGFFIAIDGGEPFVILFLLLAIEALGGVVLIKDAIMKERLRKGVQEIASGNVNYQIPVEDMQGTSREMAEKINNIGNGLQRAVEKSIKSERLKTDLITNVSHDIKTPLTSIINYVDLLKRENIENPKVQGYLDILESKAQRLKTLTEDVVEASKVSSGNIVLEYMDVNLVEMLNQTVGEFEEKFRMRDLTIVTNLPEEPAVVYADNRRLWRVLENIFNNAAKYAMPGTRVYADLWIEEQKVVFSIKNISEQQLNISADELTERFIRGDVSRSTEGSGLGLSIAQSLTEMQGGKFALYLDGDLFKVTISFPKK